MEDQNYVHRRKSIRLKEFDYSKPGAYFVTICTHDRKCLFGNIIGEKMILNKSGKMMEHWLMKLPQKFLGIQLDNYIIMPNHIHMIIHIVGVNPRVCPNESQKIQEGEHTGSPRQISLPEIVQWFKTMTTNNYIRNVKRNHWKPFNKKFWQRGYYEHIIRNEKSLDRIRHYIINNPLKWEIDKNNPQNKINI